jgi:hypothetical protein
MRRYPDEVGSIWNKMTIVMTAACPQKDKNALWIFYPTMNDRFERIEITG